jgi:hypothetical protein
MTQPSTITVLAPAFYSDPPHSTRYLRQSAARYSVPIRWYGEHQPYPGWHEVQIVRLIAELQDINTPHVLYTDASDAVFLSDLAEIELKYDTLGRPPILMSREHDGLCAGGWMGWTSYAIEALTVLRDRYPDESNPQTRWRRGRKDGAVRVTTDEDSDVFQVMTGEAGAHVQIVGRRLMNTRPGSFPCIAHWAGGFSDPEVGKGAMIGPWWKRLGYAGSEVAP